MADIKTKDSIKGTIKTIDKAAALGQRMKQAYVQNKEKAGGRNSEKSVCPRSPEIKA